MVNIPGLIDATRHVLTIIHQIQVIISNVDKYDLPDSLKSSFLILRPTLYECKCRIEDALGVPHTIDTSILTLDSRWKNRISGNIYRIKLITNLLTSGIEDRPLTVVYVNEEHPSVFLSMPGFKWVTDMVLIQ
jgi:hypothetical protein